MISSKLVRSCWSVLLMSLAGCVTPAGGVALRPDGTPGPEECSEEARKAMNYLRLFVGEAAVVQIDANQSATPITLYEGPIESMLENDLGLLDAPSRLYGRVWTGGSQAVIRYYEAQPMNGGNKIPLCAVARMGLGQLRKRPESPPGTAVVDSTTAAVFIVDSFR
ncbi:hypothetical protein D187_000980 [Cystobacter fuscus DSM 2262]|uniref:Serine/threonine protein kinase n=1 Tax=Cystobacter fuscus (strain ATCC 25194 / DSM 2262 / NBRC 100088 / M29) TaxID=1242864 RepID=S9PFN5_CYSF2|nr:hypothetical protein D187_000980 [Cystobacter fuscus DSM 2262]